MSCSLNRYRRRKCHEAFGSQERESETEGERERGRGRKREGDGLRVRDRPREPQGGQRESKAGERGTAMQRDGERDRVGVGEGDRGT